MSELARATGDTEALQCAIQLFRDLECHAFDPHGPGYIEALTRDWQPLQDMRLSDKDENGSRTMNTHLHILEPYTNLYRLWKDKQLELQLRTLIAIFTDELFNTETITLTCSSMTTGRAAAIYTAMATTSRRHGCSRKLLKCCLTLNLPIESCPSCWPLPKPQAKESAPMAR